MKQPKANALPHCGVSVLLAVLGGAIVLGGCADSGPIQDGPARPGPGVIFSYPYDGQRDIPTGARVLVAFSDQVDAVALNNACTVDDLGNVTGTFCVLGPDGLLPNVATVAGPDGNVVQFQSADMAPGTTYEVYVDPAVLETATDNLPETGPLFSFQTRQPHSIGGERPTVHTINGELPSVYSPAPDATPAPRFPGLDFATIRVLFSEPIAAETVIPGETFAFVEVDPATDAETEIDGTLLVQGMHLSFDPEVDLTPGASYRMRLSSGILDLGGEELMAAEFAFSPLSSRTNGELLPQILYTAPAEGDADYPLTSSIAGSTINAFDVFSPLIGGNTVAVKSSTIQAELANPANFGSMIPIVIRRGQLIEATGLDIHLGGAIPTDLQTGDLEIRFLSDANGFLTRNPYRDPEQLPDDEQAPTGMFLTFDIAVTAKDPRGNVVLNQNVMNVQAVGVAVIKGKSLTIEVAGSMELELLGIATASTDIVLSLSTAPDRAVPVDATAPRVLTSYPANGQDDFPVTDSLLLGFSEPVLLSQTGNTAPITLVDGDGTAVEVTLSRNGSTATITPKTPLAYGTAYTMTLNNLVTDDAGNPVQVTDDDPFGGDQSISFQTPGLSAVEPVPPLLTAVYPGAPCALTDVVEAAPARCLAGQDEDDGYIPFALPANQSLEAYFSQPIDPDTLALGTSCDTGSVRIELVNASGACAEVVQGTLAKRERGFYFEPTTPWLPGQTYRLTLISGGDTSCDTGEICSVDQQPLNGDVLAGTAANQGGGPDVAIPFVGAPADAETYVATAAVPHTDINGNGAVDDGEVRRDENRALVIITGVGGIVTDAEFVPEEDCLPETADIAEACLYLTTNLPVTIGESQTNCTVGADEQGAPVVVDQCVPVRISPQIIYGTALKLNADAVGLGIINNLSTGRLVLRLRETANEPVLGYIIDEPGTAEPQFVADLNLYMDAPDMSILGGLASHDLQSKPLLVSVKGPVSFSEDGRIRISLANTAAVDLEVGVSALLLPGSIQMQIPAGEMKLQLLSPPSKGQIR